MTTKSFVVKFFGVGIVITGILLLVGFSWRGEPGNAEMVMNDHHLSMAGNDLSVEVIASDIFNSQEDIMDIDCPSSSTCFVVADSEFAYTNNRGSSWTVETIPQALFDTSYLDIACSTTTHCIAVGEDTTVAVTQNGGSSWDAGHLDSNQELVAISCPSPQNCLALSVSDFGSPLSSAFVVRTENGGQTWIPNRIDNAILADYYDIDCPATGTCYVVGASGEIGKTNDNGKNWVFFEDLLETPLTPFDITTISCPGTEICYAVDTAGSIFKTTNGGNTWVTQDSGTDFFLDDINCPTITDCFISGNNFGSDGVDDGIFLSTTNGGNSWTAIETLTDKSIHSISCPDSKTCFAPGIDISSGTSIIWAVRDPNFYVTKSASPANVVTSGAELVYTISAVNNDEISVSTTITDSLPNQVTPNGTLSWGPIDLAPGETWTQEVAVTVNPGYTGILENVVQATTTTGESDTYTNTVKVVDATIQSVKDGSWNRADTWNLNRVPNENDVVLISSNHTVSVRGADVRGVYNYGNLSSSSASDINLSATEAISNYGQISGGTGSPGSHITLKAPSIYNEGTIQAGNGRDEGNFSKGDGGDVRMYGREMINHGTILAGRGGNDVNSPILQAGRGGDIKITGGSPSNPGTLLNDGLIRAGDGGDFVGTPSFTSLSAGRGGSVTLLSPDLRHDNGGQIYAGQGGDGNGAKDGRDGRLNIEPNTIAIAGNDTKLEGGDIIIFGGDDWVLDLSNLSAGAIQATDSITLAVGTNGVVDLQNNDSTILQAGNRIFIAADDVRLDAGTDLADVTQAGNVETGPNQILYDVSLTGPGQVTGQPGQPTSLELDVLNGGPLQDSYDVSWTDAAGWGVSSLPNSVSVAGLEVETLTLDVTPPADADSGATNVLTVTAVSQADPATQAVVAIQISVGHQVYLPLIVK